MGGVSGEPLSYVWAGTREINGVMNGCRCFYSCLWRRCSLRVVQRCTNRRLMVAPSHVPGLSSQPHTPVPNRRTYFRTEALRQEVPAHYGIALHHVSAKVGMMSRLVWEDGMSWAETGSVERPASADWLTGWPPKSEPRNIFAAGWQAQPAAQIARVLLGVCPRRLMDGRMAVRPRLFLCYPVLPLPSPSPSPSPSRASLLCLQVLQLHLQLNACGPTEARVRF